MSNEEMLQKILNCTLSYQESRYILDHQRPRLDCNDSFEKYFGLDVIYNAFEKCRTQKIDEKCISVWASVYGCLLHQVRPPIHSDTDRFRDALVYEICDWLGSIMLYDDDLYQFVKYLDDAMDAIKLQYKMYITAEKWTVYVSEEIDDCYGYAQSVNITLLCVNNKDKLYITLYGNEYYEYYFQTEKLTLEQLSKKNRRIEKSKL